VYVSNSRHLIHNRSSGSSSSSSSSYSCSYSCSSRLCTCQPHGICDTIVVVVVVVVVAIVVVVDCVRVHLTASGTQS